MNIYSVDLENTIIWKITYRNNNINLEIIHNVNNSSYCIFPKDYLFSCLLAFPQNNYDDYFIISTTLTTSPNYNVNRYSYNVAKFTRIFSLNHGSFLKYINNTDNISIYYLLFWYNIKNDREYIIQLAKNKILINDFKDLDLCSELSISQESIYYSGFIYNEKNNDYLCCTSTNGFITMWNLYEQKIFKVINSNSIELKNIIKWNNNYFIINDKVSIKIVDLENNKVITKIKAKNNKNIIDFKIIYHPLYGNSLLLKGNGNPDKLFELWSI